MTPRDYTLGRRADAAAATRESILRAAIELAFERRRIDFPLSDIARRAGTTVQTLLRHFGSRQRLIAAAVAAGTDQTRLSLDAPRGDLRRIAAILAEHHESWGRFSLAMLAAEDAGGGEVVTAAGKAMHLDWVRETFADELRAAGARSARLEDALMVVTDVSAWKVLRLDRGLSVEQVVGRTRELLEAVIGAYAPPAGR